VFAEERRAAILGRLGIDGRAQVVALAEELGVSEVTIRQDLAYLEERGLLRRTHGGAIPVETGYEMSFEDMTGEKTEEKARIAARAAALVHEGETILLDVGTTTTAVAKALAGRRNLTIVTNALNIALILEGSPGITVIVTGGTLRAKQHSLVNPLAMDVLQRIRADRAILGANGVESVAGVTNANFPEAEIKRVMANRAREKILVADSGKIGRIAAAVVAPVTAFDRLITGAEAVESEIGLLTAAGLQVDMV